MYILFKVNYYATVNSIFLPCVLCSILPFAFCNIVLLLFVFLCTLLNSVLLYFLAILFLFSVLADEVIDVDIRQRIEMSPTKSIRKLAAQTDTYICRVNESLEFCYTFYFRFVKWLCQKSINFKFYICINIK